MDTIQQQIDTIIPDYLVKQADVPVLSGLQIQGDVAIIPTRPSAKKGDPIPVTGLPVVRGENGGNTHLLIGEALTWAPSTDEFDLGVVTVPESGVGYLIHPEHGANALAPGSYRIRRQREQSDEIRRVAD